MTPYTPIPKNRITVSKDLIGNFHWELVINSYTMARSGQGYQKRANLLKALATVQKLLNVDLPVFDPTDPMAGKKKIQARKVLR